MPNSPANPSPQDPPQEIVEVDDPIYGKKRPDMSWRDHLVMMLTSGAEVEHALMVQYLYAAYSINGDQARRGARAMVEGWRASILSVAREEMGHLLTVQNMLVLLGAPISFGREMMPWDHEFYPFPFSLEPLSEERAAVLHLCRDAEAREITTRHSKPPWQTGDAAGRRRDKR